jgi:hypothetical protein
VKLLFEARVQKARNGPSTQLIKATSCVERWNATLGCIFLQESSGFLIFPFRWHFFHRNQDSCSAVTFFTPSGILSVPGLHTYLWRTKNVSLKIKIFGVLDRSTLTHYIWTHIINVSRSNLCDLIKFIALCNILMFH